MTELGKDDADMGKLTEELRESIEEALAREVREEIGLTNFTPQFLGRYVFESNRERELVHVFTTRTHAKPKISEEVADGRFFSRTDILDLMQMASSRPTSSRNGCGSSVTTDKGERNREIIVAPHDAPQPSPLPPPHLSCFCAGSACLLRKVRQSVLPTRKNASYICQRTRGQTHPHLLPGTNESGTRHEESGTRFECVRDAFANRDRGRTDNEEKRRCPTRDF